MIDPDLQNINLIPESKLTLIEIENVTKIKKQNKFLKNSIVVIVIVAIILTVKNYYDHTKDKFKANDRD